MISPDTGLTRAADNLLDHMDMPALRGHPIYIPTMGVKMLGEVTFGDCTHLADFNAMLARHHSGMRRLWLDVKMDLGRSDVTSMGKLPPAMFGTYAVLLGP